MKNRTIQISRLEALIGSLPFQLGHLAFLGSMLWLAHSASAQDSHWSGLANNGLWGDSANWTPVGVPPSVAQGLSTNGGNVFLDAANGWSVITITNGEVESPGVGGANPPWNTIFGPEWGATINIYGTVEYDWIMAPVQNDPAPGNRSLINMGGTSALSTQGAALGLGDQWWYWAAPYVTMNMYDRAQATMAGAAGLWLGGHLNIYDTATFTIQGYLNMDNRNAISDGTRSLVLGGGTLVLPTGWTAPGGAGANSGTVYDWIARGVLRAYGKGFDTNDLVITDNGANTIVTTVPLGGALRRIYFQPLLRGRMMAGTFQQATLVGDYPSVSGVLLSSAEPGLDPATFTHPLYASSDTNVIVVDTNGLVTAIHPGSAALTATLGAFTSTNSISITVTRVTASLIHRYSFEETSGTTAADSVGGTNWDGTLNGGATLGGGQVTLDGTSSYVQLPAGILSGLDEVTIEAWATFGSPVNTWANLFAFGDADSSNGQNYLTLQPHTGGGGTQATFGQGNPGSSAERNAVINNPLDGQSNLQVVAVYHPLAGYEAIYTNGVLVTAISMFNNLMDPVACAGPTYTNASILAYTLGADPWNFMGHSLYANDPTLNGSIDELRIYNGPRTASQIMADYALGPNQLIGTSTNVSLTATLTGGNLVIAWPASSALVTLQSSPTLGPGAVWAPVNANLSVVGDQYQMTVSTSGSARFYRLTQ